MTNLAMVNGEVVIRKMVSAAAIASPLMTLPQVFSIWVNQDASGISMITWFAYLVVAIIFAIYGFMMKDRPLILMYVSMAVLEVFILVGAALF